MSQLLMPKGTAIWLVEHTSLTFEQIAKFCSLHQLEVQGIADGEVAHGIQGSDPVASGQISREELKRGEADPVYVLNFREESIKVPEPARKKRGRYTPLSRRQERPNAILWLIRNHPELSNAQIIRIVGTTKSTIETVRERTHWNMNNLTAQDPVILGLCRQIDLDAELAKLAPSDTPEPGDTLITADEAVRAAAKEISSLSRTSDDEMGRKSNAGVAPQRPMSELERVFGVPTTTVPPPASITPDGETDTASANPDGETDTASVSPDGETNTASVSPDGETDAASVSPDGETDAASIAPDGETDTAGVSPDGETDTASVSPDGETDAASIAPDGETDAASIAPDGETDAASVSPGGETDAADDSKT